MIRKSPAKEIESYYNQNPFNKSCFRKRCNEPNCVLKGATDKNYLILDGDSIENSYNKNQPLRSADCILVKNDYGTNEIKVLIVEAKNDEVKIKIINEKFMTSGQEIFNAFYNQGLKLPKLSFLYMGKLTSIGRKKKSKIEVFNILFNNQNYKFIFKNTYCEADVGEYV